MNSSQINRNKEVLQQSTIIQSKQLQDQINKCMEFAVLYNILHSMNQFPFPLRNINKNNKVKVYSDNKQLSKTIKQPTKTIKQLSRTNKQQYNANKQTQKASKFQKPKSKKIQHKNIPKKINQQEIQPSEVSNYNFKGQDYADSQLILSKNDNHSFVEDSISQDGLSINDQKCQKQLDLNALVSQLMVGNNSHKQSNNDNFLFNAQKSYLNNGNRTNSNNLNAINSNNRPMNNVDRQKYDNQMNFSFSPSNAGLSSNYRNQFNKNLQNSIKYQNQYTNSYQRKKQNPYSNAQYQNSAGINPYNNYFPTTQTPYQSPYISQFRAINGNMNQSPFYQPANVNRNLFNSNKNQPYSNFYQPSNAGRNPVRNNHYIANIANQQFSPYQETQRHYNSNLSTKFQKLNNQYEKKQEFTIPNFSRIAGNGNQTNNRTPKRNNLSPLSNSISCRDFFNKSPRQISADRNGLNRSRSKSQRKLKPGGSKAFYQPPVSPRRVTHKRIQDQNYEENRATNQVSQISYSYKPKDTEEQLHLYIDLNNQKSTDKGKDRQYKRNQNRITRQTDFSGLTGNEINRSKTQKSSTSNKVFVNQNKERDENRIKRQVVNKDTERNNVELRTKQLKNQKVMENKRGRKASVSSKEQESSQQDFDLNQIQNQMQILSNSRKNIPSSSHNVQKPRNPQRK